MLGAIIGDIVGSRFEFNNTHDADFEFFHNDCKVTDDSVMTVAVMAAMLEGSLDAETKYKANVIKQFKQFYALFPNSGYGLGFKDCLGSDEPKPYNSFGNGACMRVSPVAVLVDTERKAVTKWTTEVSHNHPLALAWTEFLTSAIAIVKTMSITDAKAYLTNALEDTFTADNIDKYYLNGTPDICPGLFDETCQGVMPIAVRAVIEADDFETAIRNAVKYGGDSDTIACITGSLAEAVFGISASTRRAVTRFIPAELMSVIREFYREFVK